MHHVVSLSGGTASAVAADRTLAKFERVVLVDNIHGQRGE